MKYSSKIYIYSNRKHLLANGVDFRKPYVTTLYSLLAYIENRLMLFRKKKETYSEKYMKVRALKSLNSPICSSLLSQCFFLFWFKWSSMSLSCSSSFQATIWKFLVWKTGKLSNKKNPGTILFC